MAHLASRLMSPRTDPSALYGSSRVCRRGSTCSFSSKLHLLWPTNTMSLSLSPRKTNLYRQGGIPSFLVSCIVGALVPVLPLPLPPVQLLVQPPVHPPVQPQPQPCRTRPQQQGESGRACLAASSTSLSTSLLSASSSLLLTLLGLPLRPLGFLSRIKIRLTRDTRDNRDARHERGQTRNTAARSKEARKLSEPAAVRQSGSQAVRQHLPHGCSLQWNEALKHGLSSCSFASFSSCIASVAPSIFLHLSVPALVTTLTVSRSHCVSLSLGFDLIVSRPRCVSPSPCFTLAVFRSHCSH